MKVLILNSDSPHNRGDRAILAGLIELVRDIAPDAEITALSQFKNRDEAWFKIKFLKQSPYSTSPFAYLWLLHVAKRSDVVLWGGGELLKDYTNKLSLFYWALKLWGLRRVNKNIIGAFQGIGPTQAPISQRVIISAVNQCREFLVRDKESAEKLQSWGAKARVVASYDPAVYVSPPVDAGFPLLDAPVGIGLRRWFHYRQSGWLPARFRFWQPKAAAPVGKELLYLQRCAQLADHLVETQEADLVFFPMHMAKAEDDAGFARQVIALMKHGNRASVADADDLSPKQLLEQIAACKLFVASRLHSAIIASVAQVPAICLYYVDKGRLFFEQMQTARYSLPIEVMLEDDAIERLGDLIDSLSFDAEPVRAQQRDSILQMRFQLLRDLGQAMSNRGSH